MSSTASSDTTTGRSEFEEKGDGDTEGCWKTRGQRRKKITRQKEISRKKMAGSDVSFFLSPSFDSRLSLLYPLFYLPRYALLSLSFLQELRAQGLPGAPEEDHRQRLGALRRRGQAREPRRADERRRQAGLPRQARKFFICSFRAFSLFSNCLFGRLCEV